MRCPFWLLLASLTPKLKKEREIEKGIDCYRTKNYLGLIGCVPEEPARQGVIEGETTVKNQALGYIY